MMIVRKTYLTKIPVAAAMLAVLAVLAVATCEPRDVGGVTLDIDEEAIVEIQARLDGWMTGSSHGPDGDPGRLIDPDVDEEYIRNYARGAARRWITEPSVVLNEAETDLLLERMRATKAARIEAKKEAAK